MEQDETLRHHQNLHSRSPNLFGEVSESSLHTSLGENFAGQRRRPYWKDGEDVGYASNIIKLCRSKSFQKDQTKNHSDCLAPRKKCKILQGDDPQPRIN